jgi:hypothetical protein
MCGTGSKHSKGGLFGGGFGSTDPRTIRAFGGVPKDSSSKVKKDLPPKKSSPPSGGPTRLGIGRKSSTQKRSGVSGRSRSKRKAFSSTKR